MLCAHSYVRASACVRLSLNVCACLCDVWHAWLSQLWSTPSLQKVLLGAEALPSISCGFLCVRVCGGYSAGGMCACVACSLHLCVSAGAGFTACMHGLWPALSFKCRSAGSWLQSRQLRCGMRKRVRAQSSCWSFRAWTCWPRGRCALVVLYAHKYTHKPGPVGHEAGAPWWCLICTNTRTHTHTNKPGLCTWHSHLCTTMCTRMHLGYAVHRSA